MAALLIAVCIATFGAVITGYGNIHNEVNVTNLIQKYILVCGYDFLCNKSYITGYRELKKDYSNSGICPTCYCDQLCLARGDCCPDKFLDNPIYKCVSNSVLQNSSNDKNYRMLDHCPDTVTKEERDKCGRDLDDVDRLTSLPVTVMKTLTTYRNKYCANCNGDLDYVPWRLDFSCYKLVDFNFISSYQEVLDMAEENKCNISYEPPTTDVETSECIDSTVTKYNKCNMTGLWQKYDQDVDWACNNLQLKFRIFENIFCYICNPSLSEYNKVINTCNTTGRLKDFDQHLWDACSTQPLTHVTYPFKNSFCFLCNMDNVSPYSKLDASVSISEHFDSSVVTYTIKIAAFDIEYFSYKRTSYNSSLFTGQHILPYMPYSIIKENFISDIVIRNGEKINVTELVYKYMSYTTELPICPTVHKYETYMLNYQTYCDCQDSCIFSTYDNCCIDLLLRYPFSCISNQELSSPDSKYTETYYYVTDQCWRQGVSPELKSLCESTGKDDHLLNIPLKSTTSGIHYKNWYCFVCNEYSLNTWDISDLYAFINETDYELWELIVICHSYLDYTYYPTISSVLDTAKNRSCQISFHPLTNPWSPDPPICEKATASVDKCPQRWNKDDSIQWACEHLNHPSFPEVDNHKNVFCKMCNVDLIGHINTCNESGDMPFYDPNIETACLNLPAIPGAFPFKNKFCKLCNFVPPLTTTYPTSVTTPSRSTPPQNDPTFSLPEITFRSIFSLTAYETIDQSVQGSEQKCNANFAVYDPWKDECRNKTCFPGKLLINETCIPLFRVTTNLGYILSFRLEASGVKGNLSLMNLLQNMQGQLINNTKLRSDDISVISFYVMSNKPCDTVLSNTSNIDLHIRMYIQFYINIFVDRLVVEETLQNSKNTTYIFSVEGGDIYFQSFEDLDSTYVPLMVKFLSSDRCFFVESNRLSIISSYITYRFVHVSSLLLCVQIELESKEYIIDRIKLQLQMLSSGTVLSHDKFQLLPDNKARVCVEDFPDYKKKSNLDTDTYILHTLTLICTIISSCCLFATFVTYCLFPILQSIPGKNNMALIVSIFFSQLLFQFGVKQTDILELCVFIGILSHFFWLSMFGCMNICSLHMFRVFRAINLPSGNDRNTKKITLRYAALSYGIPACIVLINVSVHLGITKGTDIGYGTRKCFISHKLSYILTLLVPLIIICVLNIIFFVVTLYKIRTLPKVQSNKKDRNEVAIYIKLFTLTGILWLLQVLDSFFPTSVFSFIVTIMNGLQGLFIFISYICNRRVLNLYKYRFVTSRYAVDSTTSESTLVTYDSTRASTNSPRVSSK